MQDNYFYRLNHYAAPFFENAADMNLIPNAKPDINGDIYLSAIDLGGLILLPEMNSPIVLQTNEDLNIILSALKANQTLLGVIKKPNDKYSSIGIEMAVCRIFQLPDGKSSTIVQGRRRVKILEKLPLEKEKKVRSKLAEQFHAGSEKEKKALARTANALLAEIGRLDRTIPEEIVGYAADLKDPGIIADFIAGSLTLDKKIKLYFLEQIDSQKRLEKLNTVMAEEIELLSLGNQIHVNIQNELNKKQREKYLREQAHLIQNELGEKNFWDKEIDRYQKELEKLNPVELVKTTIENEIRKLSNYPAFSPESGIIKTYIEWLLSLPWKTTSIEEISLKRAGKILKKSHFGLQKAKERILEYLAVRMLNPEVIQPILCFIGPPGTGKTSLGKSVAEALNRKFARLSLGGIKDEAEIRGHRRTYIGAMPGRIIQSIRQAGVFNPVFMLDEIDKLCNDFNGDPAAALMEVLDNEQNYAFSDHYLEIPFDLSGVFFITSANNIENIPSALIDRMEVIEFPGYIDEEKISIAKEFLIPKQLRLNGLIEKDIFLQESLLFKMIREYTYEAGVRNLEKEISKLFRKLAKMKALGKKYPNLVSENDLKKYLGPPQFSINKLEKTEGIGICTAVAWTENGGEIMPVEVVVMEGKGNLQITGKIGEIMQESAQAAFSYIKSRAERYAIEEEYFDKVDVHIHIPEGAIEKDGPSAGITICTAILSAILKRKVHLDIGATGEITLSGNLLQVGGLKEKIYAANRAGLKQVLIPERNRNDLSELPKKLREEIKIILIDTIDQALRILLYP